MTCDTINNDVTMAGGAEGALLANRYRIVRQLGQGGMGSVWLAEDTQLDNKLFAIKMLPSILVSNKRAYRQLKDEALVAMKLVHPNIVQLRAFEENGGNPFLVMDYIDGGTLDDYLADKGKLSEDEVVRILKPIAAALDYAHGEGVVHRDVKRANIMMRKDGHPYILDFGIAREIQETMTRVTGKLSSGTLLYMSPEQLNGDSPKPAQDVYSFAAMAYECLKGEPPFSRGNVEFQIMNKQPELLPGGLTGKAAILAAGVMSGLAKKPEDRPATCLAVLDGKDLGRVERADGANMTDAPRASVRVHPPNASLNHPAAMDGDSSFPQTQKGRSKTGIVIAVGILALFASIGVGGLWLMLGRTEASDAVMTPDPAKVSADAIFSEARSNMTACKRLDSGDGFRARIEECQSSFNSAMTKYDLGHWSAAAQAFTNVSEKCRTLIAADVERDNAKTAASLLSESIKAAKDAEAQKFAKIRYESATKMANRGRGEFGDFKFAAAAATYESARGLFDLAAQEAEQVKIEEASRKEVELKRKQEEERKAEETRQAEEARRGEEERIQTGSGSDDFDSLLADMEGAATPVKVTTQLDGKPTAFVVAAIDGRKIEGGRLNDGKQDYMLPLKWTLVEGKRYGPYNVSYISSGRRYVGVFDAVSVDWRGPRTFVVSLKESVKPRHGDVKMLTLPGGATMEVIYVGPGTFTMGSPTIEDGHANDEVQHRVALTKGFWLGKYEVTQKQWLSVMDDNPSRWRGEDLPVAGVSWHSCQEFIHKINMGRNFVARLPTEAEWEYASRAGTKHACADILDSMAWFAKNSEGEVHAVGTKKSNAWGFCDMYGNVSEWCNDWYGDYADGESRDPRGPSSGASRVLRGGSADDFDRSCRSAARSWDAPGHSLFKYGFRLCFFDISNDT